MSIREKMKLFYENPVVAWHEHMWITGDYDFDKLDIAQADGIREVMDIIGIDKLVTSIPVNSIKRCEPEVFRAANNTTFEATKRYPGKVYGMAYVHPGHLSAALDEIDRCITELGFVGIKLYYDYFMDDPAYYPIIEKCIKLDIPILQHSMHCMDAPNHIRQPLCSDGVHMANAARRYPEATFLMGHFTIAEWKWSLKAIADTPNVYTDIGGSLYDRPQMEEAVSLLGARRMLFATDGAFSVAAGRILGADISEEDKKTILAGTDFLRFIEKAGR